MVALLVSVVLVAQRSKPVVFTYESAKARNVAISGDFNAWSSPIPMKATGAKWSKSFDLPNNGRIEYKLVVDGEWMLDPSNPQKFPNGLGGENSVWTGPKYKFAVHDQTPKNPMARKVVIVDGRQIVVFSPLKSAGLPLLIYGDGPNYEQYGRIQNVLENLVEAGKVRPAILVLVPPIDRLKEYGPDWRDYGKYVFNRVLPAVRKATGASNKATETYMGGSSMGGLISLRLAEHFPDQLSGGIHCQSSAIQWTALSLHNDDVASHENLAKISSHTRIHLDWGDFEENLTSANLRLSKTLKGMNRPFGTFTTPEGHTWTAWRNRMETGLVYLLGRGAYMDNSAQSSGRRIGLPHS